MSTEQNTTEPLYGQKQPVFMTRQSAARLLGVHDYTFGKYAVPDAWRRETDGKLSALYSQAAVEAFRASWRDHRRAEKTGGEL